MHYNDIKASQTALSYAIQANRHGKRQRQSEIAIEIESNRQRTILRQALNALGRGNESEVKQLLGQYTKGTRP